MIDRCFLAIVLTISYAAFADAQSRCAARKLAASAEKVGCLFALEAKEAKSGAPKNPNRVQACREGLLGAFAKAETAGDCVTTGDAADVEARIDAFVANWDIALSGPDQPPPSGSRCAAAELKATGKKAKCVLAGYANAAAKGGPLEDRTLSRCMDEFEAGFEAAEAHGDCEETEPDEVEDGVDGFVFQLDTALTTPPPTTTTTSSTTTTTNPLVPGCGNGIIEGSEECDGDVVCNDSCLIDRRACCQFGTECSASVGAYILSVYQYNACGQFGGTFMNGAVPSGTEPCPSDASRSLGPCVAAPGYPTPVTVCCELADHCEELTTQADVTSWYYSCAYRSYPNWRAVVGTCGADGKCVPRP